MEKSEQVTVDHPEPGQSTEPSYVPPIDEAELVRRNQAVMRLLDAWEQDEEGEQRETLAVLKAALGEHRIASSRNLFP
jgi:hypothetical protein